jgi:hypothetical protein
VRKLLVLLLVCGLVSLGAAGCGKKSDMKDRKPADTKPVRDVEEGESGPDEKPPKVFDEKYAHTEAAKSPKDSGDKKKDKSAGDKKPDMASKEGAAEEAVVGKRAKTAPARKEKEQQSGLLTAGSFDDNLYPEPFRSFVSKLGQDNQYVADIPGLFLGQRLVVAVRGRDGKPVGNARVTVTSAGGGAGVNLTTRTDGTAVFLSSWDHVAADENFAVTVTPPNGAPPVRQIVPRRAQRWEIPLAGVQTPLPEKLDLTLVLDTTGSMGDELEYLKAEIKSIADAVDRKFPHVDKRYGLVLYRDQGDNYVTRTFAFTPSLGQFRKNLSAQRAAGGGDYPEAMHEGLEKAVQLQWRSGPTARVLFLVADAPPHAQFAERTMRAVDALRKKGVAIYPVAASGADDACEFIMRSAALLTGGQYIFLTNDSGVGDAHAEPHIPYYHVERLNRLMVRMITSELSGRRIDPQPGDILRTVGRPINTTARK